MGFQQNTVSYTAYEVLETPGGDWRDLALNGLSKGRISRIDVEIGHDRAAGFATFDDPLDIEFTAEKVFFDPLVLFTFRMDKVSIPSSTLKLYVRQRVARSLAETRRAKMPRDEREEIADSVRGELLRRAIPAISAWDVVWDVPSSRLRLFTTSQAANEEFVARARDALGLALRPLNTVGVLEARLDEDELARAYHLLPTSFLAGGEAGDTPEEEG